jgi:hypothetical protein
LTISSFAHTNIFFTPNLGIVKFLIIDGENRIRDENEDDVGIISEETQHVLAPDAVDDQSSVVFRRRHTKDVLVTLLHVSYKAGYELMEIILNEDGDIRRAGGTRVVLDNISPSSSPALLILWIVLCAVIICSACCFLANAIANMLESSQPENEQLQPARHRGRQRLTLEQIRKIEIGVFDGSKLLYKSREESDEGEDENIPLTQPIPAPHSLESCTICLDEYVAGDKLRCLPCSHVFHSRCIAKWLIERSATCPLCKIDLYEEEDGQQAIHGEQQQQQSPTLNLFSSWASVPPEAATAPSDEAANPASGESWTRAFRRSVERLGSWSRSIFVTPGQRRRMVARQVSEALAEPLLRQQQGGADEELGSQENVNRSHEEVAEGENGAGIGASTSNGAYQSHSV